MQRKTISLHFGNDVFTYETRDKVPYDRGIYIVYSGKYDGQFVNLNKLLYIGKSDKTTFSDRIKNHHDADYSVWERYCDQNEKIYYRVAELNEDIKEVESCMIFTYKPPCNSVGVDNFIGLRPAPNVYTDLAIQDIDGSLIDIRDLNQKLPQSH